MAPLIIYREPASGEIVVADFIGTQRCKLDSKGRLQVPAGFRRTLGLEGGETFVLSKGFDKGLLLFAPEGWRDFQVKLNGLPAGPEKRKAIRYFSASSASLQVDKQGRVSLPKPFLEILGAPGELVVVGALDRIELWNPVDFDGELANVDEALRQVERLL